MRAFGIVVVVWLICSGCASTVAHGAGVLGVSQEVVEQGGRHHLRLTVAGQEVVAPDGRPLYSDTQCDIRLTSVSVPDGCLLQYHIRNQTDGPLDMPDLQVGGITLPRDDVQLIENWKNIRFKDPGKQRKPQYFLHAVRSYPGGIYSPVMGLRTNELFLGTALMFEPMAIKREVHLDYTYDYDRKQWCMVYRFWDQPVIRIKVKDPDTGKERSRPQVPPVAKIAPGESLTLTVSVCVAPAAGEEWVTAFRAYRDFFRKTYGQVRYKTTNEPIWARSMGISPLCSPTNPRGYGSKSSGDQQGRIDERGWAGFHDEVMREVWGRGFRRMMIWQIAGSYMHNRGCNMVWEIGTGHSPKMMQTCAEIERLRKAGFTVGFWWGRAFTPSIGFDSGVRSAVDPDNPDHLVWTCRELDAVRDMGVRLIGCDDSPHSLYATDWKPSVDVLQHQWFPELYKRYPEMQWVIETAACDFQHVWGSSFMWSREVTGACTFARYVVPDSETNVTIKRGRGNTSQEWLDQLIRWGYTPIVFNDQFKLEVKRELLGKQQ